MAGNVILSFLQDKNMRTLALNCLWQCLHSYLARLAPVSGAGAVAACLTKHTRPILQMLRKNTLSLPEQHVRPLQL